MLSHSCPSGTSHLIDCKKCHATTFSRKQSHPRCFARILLALPSNLRGFSHSPQRCNGVWPGHLQGTSKYVAELNPEQMLRKLPYANAAKEELHRGQFMGQIKKVHFPGLRTSALPSCFFRAASVWGESCGSCKHNHESEPRLTPNGS